MPSQEEVELIGRVLRGEITAEEAGLPASMIEDMRGEDPPAGGLDVLGDRLAELTRKTVELQRARTMDRASSAAALVAERLTETSAAFAMAGEAFGGLSRALEELKALEGGGRDDEEDHEQKAAER